MKLVALRQQESGEEVVRTVGSFLIVELMRQGKSPQEACEEGVRRIIAKNKNRTRFPNRLYCHQQKRGNRSFLHTTWF